MSDIYNALMRKYQDALKHGDEERISAVMLDEVINEIERLSYEPLTTRAHECPRCHMKWIDAPKEDHEVPNL